MLQQLAILAIKIGEHEMKLHLPPDAPLGVVFDALVQMTSYVVGRINEHHDAQKAAKEQPAIEPKIEEVIQDV